MNKNGNNGGPPNAESLPLTQPSKRQRRYGIENTPLSNCVPMDESFLHCKCPDATMDWNQWWSWYDCRWGKYTMFNLQWRSACSGCEREASVKDEAGENKAIVYIPVSECQSIMSSPPLSSLAIHWSLLRGFPTSFPARQWRYGDIVTMLEVESEVKAINVIVVILFRAYCMKQKRD